MPHSPHALTDRQWQQLDRVLALAAEPLRDAGWEEVADGRWGELDRSAITGFTTLHRSGFVLGLAARLSERRIIEFQPADGGEGPTPLSATITVDLDRPATPAHLDLTALSDEDLDVDLATLLSDTGLPPDVARVQVAAWRAGLLDPTTVALARDSDGDLHQWWASHWVRWVWGPAIAAGADGQVLLQDKHLKLVAEHALPLTQGSSPDPVPRAAARGLIHQVWRNPVEPYHDAVGHDEVMAWTTLNLVHAVQAHVSRRRIDWDGVRRVLLGGAGLPLTGGWSAVFGRSWPQAQVTLTNSIDSWQQSSALLTGDGAVRLFAALAGAERWAGSALWPAACRISIRELVGADVTVPGWQGTWRSLLAVLTVAPHTLSPATLEPLLLGVRLPNTSAEDSPGGTRHAKPEPISAALVWPA